MGEVLIDGSLDRSSILLSSIKKVHCNIERITVDFFFAQAQAGQALFFMNIFYKKYN